MSYPDQLKQEAKSIYDDIKKILEDEERWNTKYRFTVAVAANAMYLYQEALGECTYLDIGIINKASSEYLKAARVLLLTPEAELKIRIPEPEQKEKPSLMDVLGGSSASKNDNYGHKGPDRKSSSYEKISKGNKAAKG